MSERNIKIIIRSKNHVFENNSDNYKLSSYNVILKKISDQWLIFNNLTNAMALLSADLYQLLFHSKEEEWNHNIPIPALSRLIENGFLVDKAFHEIEYVKDYIYSKKEASCSAVVVIAPTTNCNMNCPYCFEAGVVDPRQMTSEIEDKVISFIKEKYADRKELSVVWYGGEPLLCMPTINHISHQLIDYFHAKDSSYAAGLVTNASLLSPSVADQLVQCQVKVMQVTLDGLEEAHDLRRKKKDGNGTFRQIIHNLDYAKDLFRISLRINVDKENIESVAKLLTWLQEEKSDWNNKVVPYVAPVTRVHEKMGYQKVFTRSEFGEVFEKKFLIYFMNRKDTNTNLLKSSKEYFLDQCCALERKAWRGLHTFALTNPCGTASCNLLTIDPLGKLYKCWDTVGVKEHVIGDVFVGDYGNEVSDMWSSYKLHNKCLECNYLPVCMGGCTRECIVNQKPSCPQDFIYYKDVLIDYYDRWKTS